MNKNLESLGMLVGFLLTDGCVSSSKFIVFHNKSEEMHKYFQKLATEIFGDVHFTERLDNNNTKRTQITSKYKVKQLIEFCQIETFRRKRFDNGNFPKVRLPDFIRTMPKSSILKFLQIIFSADGSISLSVRWHKRNKGWEIRRRIELTCKHKQLRNDFLELIKQNGFNPRTSGENITLERKDDILNFFHNVKFIPGVKIGGDSINWKGLEKNQILELAVKTFDLNKNKLEKFETKQQVIDFLRSQIQTS